jgi:rRNA processing protein Krr1/Pno1
LSGTSVSPIARHIDIELRQRNEEIEKLEKLINHVIAYRKRVRAIIRNLENVNVRKKTVKNCMNGHRHKTPLQVFQKCRRVTKNRKIINQNNCLHLFENIKYKQKH